MTRKLDLSFGITVKDVPLEELLPLLDQIRQLAGDGTLKLDPQTERLLKRHAPAALPQGDQLALEGNAGGGRRELGHDGRAADTPLHTVASGDDIRALGKLVRSLRVKKGMSLAVLGRRAKVHVSYLSKIERGIIVPGERICGRLAEALGCDLDHLHASAIEARIAKLEARVGRRGLTY